MICPFSFSPACVIYLAITGRGWSPRTITTETTGSSIIDGIRYTPLRPASYPIAVRNPYLSAWLPGKQVESLPRCSPQFWKGQNLTWGVLARVNEKTYNLFGIADADEVRADAKVINATYTATHTVYHLTAGSVSFMLDFFSPVSPSNYVRQSLPFSYLTVTASSNVPHFLQLYSDIDDTWSGQTGNSMVKYIQYMADHIFSLTVKDAKTYDQNDQEMALWGEVVFASRPLDNSTESTHIDQAIGNNTLLRTIFEKSGNVSLINSTHTSFSYLKQGDGVAITHDLGSVQTPKSVTYSIGYVRQKAILYLDDSRTGYYQSQYKNTSQAVSAFISDYPHAYSESRSIDIKLDVHASAISFNYSDILKLSVRQAFGAMDLTISEATLNSTDILVFWKEVSSDGNINTFDLIISSFPILYVFNSEWLRFVMDPMMRYLADGGWSHPWVIHDMGSNYPLAVGHPSGRAEELPIEETGDLIILAYAYAQSSPVVGRAWVNNYQSVLQKFADYLVSGGNPLPTSVENLQDISLALVGLNMPPQFGGSDALGRNANQTNLAIKQAIGLNAFGILFNQPKYSAIGIEFAQALYNQQLATSGSPPTHFTTSYPNDTSASWTTAYNLWLDHFFNFKTFNASAFAMQSAHYPAMRLTRGVPIEDGILWSRTDFMLWAAAANVDRSTRDMMINDVHAFIANSAVNTAPLSDRFFVDGPLAGLEYKWRARPVVGGHFSLLAQKLGPNSMKV